MPNYNPLIYTASDYKILLLDGGTALPLLTVSEFDADIKVESEKIYAIGETNAIGAKTNGQDITGKFTIQKGELEVFLRTKGYASAVQIQGAIIALTSLDGVINKTYIGVNIESDGFSLKAKDKHSEGSMSWSAVEVVSI